VSVTPSRRHVLAIGLAGLASACARHAPGALIDLTPVLATSVRDRDYPTYFHLGTSSFHEHVRRQDYDVGGIDYGPAASNEDTLVCPVAAGVVIGAHDTTSSSGMALVIGHGLGWKTYYAHLQARFIGYRERVDRRDVTAVMGASGTGASRGGVGVARHLHLTLFGPTWAALFARASRQDRPASNLGYRHILDPEEFSLGGRNEFLPYSRGDDAEYDRAFATLHNEAVRVADDLLDRIGDADAVRTRTREQFERDTHFDYHVDQRIWFLWQRLDRGPHPFTDDETRAHRATLLRFMSAAPRFTAPIVEPARRSEYRVRRDQPIKTYDARSM